MRTTILFPLLLLAGCAHRVHVTTPDEQVILNLQTCVATGQRGCDSQIAAYRALVMQKVKQ